MIDKFEKWWNEGGPYKNDPYITAGDEKSIAYYAWEECKGQILKELKAAIHQPIDCGIEIIDPSITIDKIEKEF